MIEPMTIAWVSVTLDGVAIGFPAGGEPKVGGRTAAVSGEDRAVRVKRG